MCILLFLCGFTFVFVCLKLSLFCYDFWRIVYLGMKLYIDIFPPALWRFVFSDLFLLVVNPTFFFFLIKTHLGVPRWLGQLSIQFMDSGFQLRSWYHGSERSSLASGSMLSGCLLVYSLPLPFPLLMRTCMRSQINKSLKKNKKHFFSRNFSPSVL